MSSPAAYSATVHSTRPLSRAAQPGTNAMDLPELLRSINLVAQTGATPQHCEALVRQVYSFADMVGWATGPIDPQGRLLERLAALQGDLGVRYAQTRDAALAALHDSLTDLGRAIAQHDEDLDPAGDGDDEADDFR